jgi:hypothetical protein
MITIWFLMSLVAYPNLPGIMYKGYGGFLSSEECEEKRILVENSIADFEIQKGRIAYIETYCVEMQAFESQLKEKNKKSNSIGFEV